MLKIRSEQIRPFQPNAETAFVHRVMKYLRENHPETKVRFQGKQFTVVGLPDETLKNLVEKGIARAENYGLSWKSSLISFVVLMFIVAPNFDRQKYVAGVLTDDNIPADKRLEIITEQMMDEDWEKIAESYDEKSWENVAAATVGGSK